MGMIKKWFYLFCLLWYSNHFPLLIWISVSFTMCFWFRLDALLNKHEREQERKIISSLIWIMQKWEYGISSNMSRGISFLLGSILLYSHSSHAGFLYAKTSLRRHWNGKDGMWSSKMNLRVYFTQDNLLSFNNIRTEYRLSSNIPIINFTRNLHWNVVYLLFLLVRFYVSMRSYSHSSTKFLHGDGLCVVHPKNYLYYFVAHKMSFLSA